MKRSDLLPLKAVLAEIGVSRTTLWRARESGLKSLPQPVRIGRGLYWLKTDLDAMEEALIRFAGRGAFERQRKAARLQRAKAGAIRKRKATGPLLQGELFAVAPGVPAAEGAPPGRAGK